MNLTTSLVLLQLGFSHASWNLSPRLTQVLHPLDSYPHLQLTILSVLVYSIYIIHLDSDSSPAFASPFISLLYTPYPNNTNFSSLFFSLRCVWYAHSKELIGLIFLLVFSFLV
ncbi:hypothetical protein RchiOBHm_Chr1g0381891 [Rosa chinensis]|uniref:Uncharacterized protein n=1 Tax=Rosa chinensis TaxID=74649 RepID=A0A2P6SP95_ROSCH|nr:hypothetical protein RchiOBHm_Chr1g0381891 [Rosa chinensis]